MSTMLALRRRARNLVVSILTAVVLTTSVLVPASASTRREPGRAARGVPANNALDLDGTNDYVTFGAAPGLGAATFTLELWFRRDGAGVATSTGTGGLASAVPLLTKGRGEADGDNRDMNYILNVFAT